MSSVRWDAEIADVYDETYAAMFQPSVLGPMADVLAELAGGGAALEFAIGTSGSQHQVAVFERLTG